MAEITVRVEVAFMCKLPADEADRKKWYGTSDIGECIRVDFDTDTAALMLDADWEILSIEVPA